jgi:hypothetical protein
VDICAKNIMRSEVVDNFSFKLIVIVVAIAVFVFHLLDNPC